MNSEIMRGLLIPLAGTSAGSALVFFLKDKLSRNTERVMNGFASGVMIAASIWSLLLPAMEQSSTSGAMRFIPAVLGYWAGIMFLLVLDHVVPHLHLHADRPEGKSGHYSRTMLMLMAVTIHNIPEGMAVGVLYAGLNQGNKGITSMAALALAVGIAIQNVPEGAIISMPLHSEGVPKPKSFWYGVISGAVEPVAGFITILLADAIVPVMPYLLSFAAGAMMYVVVEELIPEMSSGEHSNLGTIAFAVGFTLMMVLDIALG